MRVTASSFLILIAIFVQIAFGQVRQQESGITGAWVLTFPLMSGQDSTNAAINSIFDHAMTAQYSPGSSTVAFTGERGDVQYGFDNVTGTTHYGYAQSGSVPFIVNGYYLGGGNKHYLYYNGHPGYDFQASAGADIYAPADGYLSFADISSNGISCNGYYIDHQNGYRSLILHSKAGTVIAEGWVTRGVTKTSEVGDSCVEGHPHLHYQLEKKIGGIWTAVDPYGWSGGCGTSGDPYAAIAISANLWVNSGLLWDFSTAGNTQGWSVTSDQYGPTSDCFAVTGGSFTIDPRGSHPDPGIISPPLLNITGGGYPAIKIRMASNGVDGNGRIYFATDLPASNWSEMQAVSFNVNNDGAFHDYVVDMSTNSIWTASQITAIRIDPAAGGSPGDDTIAFDSIELASNTMQCQVSVSTSSINTDSTPQSLLISVNPEPSTCQWTASSGSANVSITSGTTGVGPGTVSVSLPANTTGADLSSILTIAGQTVTVLQRFTSNLFSDVDPVDFFFDAVNLLKNYSITAGCSSSPPSFCPNDNITRGQAAVFIVRAILGSDNFQYSSTPYFTDAPATYQFFKWIQKMKELGITAGCGTNAYCPDATITRGQMAVFVIRARYGSTATFAYPTTPVFADVPATNIFFNWIQKLAQTGITAGCSATLFCPDDAVTRGQMAIFVMRGGFNQLLSSSTPVISGISPSSGFAGVSVQVAVTGTGTTFVDGMTTVTAGPGITVTGVSVTSSTSLTAMLDIGVTAAAGPRTILVITGSEEAVSPNGFIVNAPTSNTSWLAFSSGNPGTRDCPTFR